MINIVWGGRAEGGELRRGRGDADEQKAAACRLVQGKITYVHQRLWPALVRVSKRLPLEHLAKIHETHTASGRHITEQVAFPDWVTRELAAQASQLDEWGALDALGLGAR